MLELATYDINNNNILEIYNIIIYSNSIEIIY